VTAITKWRFVWSATHNGRPNALPGNARHRMLKEGKSGSKKRNAFFWVPRNAPAPQSQNPRARGRVGAGF
jgi:hypothetical protein